MIKTEKHLCKNTGVIRVDLMVPLNCRMAMEKQLRKMLRFVNGVPEVLKAEGVRLSTMDSELSFMLDEMIYLNRISIRIEADGDDGSVDIDAAAERLTEILRQRWQEPLKGRRRR